MEKIKFVGLEHDVHKKIKRIATEKESTIQREVNDILKKELSIGENKYEQ